jgi:hypothetical protein
MKYMLLLLYTKKEFGKYPNSKQEIIKISYYLTVTIAIRLEAVFCTPNPL